MCARWLYDDHCARWENVQKKNVHDEFPMRKKINCARWVQDEKQRPSVHDTCTMTLRWALCTMRIRARWECVHDEKTCRKKTCTMSARWMHDELKMTKKTRTMSARWEKKRARWVHDELKMRKKNVHDECKMRKKGHPCTMRARWLYDDHCARWENVLKKNVHVTFPM